MPLGKSNTILTTFILPRSSCSKILHLNTESLHNIYNLWDPSARICISLAKDPDNVGGHEWAAVKAAYYFIQDNSRFNDLQPGSMHQLFVE